MFKAVSSPLPALAIGAPLLLSLAIFGIGRKFEKLRERIAVLSVGISLVLVLSMMGGALKGTAYKCYLFQMTPQIWMHLRADPLGVGFGVVACVLWLMATIYSVGYMADEHAKTRYFTFLIFNFTMTLGVAFAGNLLTLFIFYELFSISTYPLIAHEETPEAMAAAKKYIIYILIGGSLVLFGVIFTFYLAGTQTLIRAGILSMKHGATTLSILFAVFVTGFGVKAAIMPLHGWVPDAHPEAPAPASALLSGVMVAVGTFCIMRVVYNVFGARLVMELGVGVVLAYVVSVTIIISSIMALDQDNLKRRLAYSTIGQMSYIVLGTALLNPMAAWGAIIHIANHAFMKGTLFMCSGVLLKKGKKRNVSELKGIGRKFPITMAAFSVAALAMIGTPPLAGFFSKWFLGMGSLNAHKPVFVVVLLLSSLLGAAYFLPIIYAAFFQKEDEEKESATGHGEEGHEEEDDGRQRIKSEIKQVSWVMLGPIVVGAFGVLLLGVCAAANGFPLSLAKVAVKVFLK